MNGALVITRALHLAATLSLAGTLIFRCLVAAPAFHPKGDAALEGDLCLRLAWMTWGALAIVIASGAAWLVLLAADIGGVPVADATAQGLPWTVLTQTAFGDDWMLRFEMAALLAVLLLAPRPSPGFASAIDVACAILAAALAASLAWAGHAAGTEGIDGAIHLASDALHLVAAGAWLGALWPLAILLNGARQAGDPVSAAMARQATRRFSVLGMISVAAILATGVINTYEILGASAFSLDTDYNRLLLAKIGLFAAMLAFAAVNRQRLTPRLADECDRGRAMRQLQRNSVTEAGLGLLILFIVAVLGRISPHE